MSDDKTETDEMLEAREKGKYLPPLHRIQMPETRTQSAKIRWLHLLGYQTKDIANGLGIRYQQARNIITTEPKRAAREDIPPLEIKLVAVEDIVDTLLGSELERTFGEERKARKRAANQQARRPREIVEDDEVDEINEYAEEDDND